MAVGLKLPARKFTKKCLVYHSQKFYEKIPKDKKQIGVVDGMLLWVLCRKKGRVKFSCK